MKVDFTFRHNIRQYMREITATFAIIMMLTCGAIAQNLDCNRTAFFGDSKICLPIIEGYQECYLDTIVKELADETELPANMVLGFYLSDETYERKDSLGFFSFDNYFKIYGTKEIKDYPANQEMLNQIQGVLAGNFISKNWGLMEKEVDKIGLEVDIGVPLMIKSYNQTKNSFTIILLVKYESEGFEPYIMAMTLNGLIINQRLVWMAYYLNYEDKETIKKLQENSNFILTQLLDARK